MLICNNINDGMTSTSNASSYSFTIVNNGNPITAPFNLTNPKVCGQPTLQDCLNTCKEVYYNCIAHANNGPATACETAMQNCINAC